jgi:hypothetical protein
MHSPARSDVRRCWIGARVRFQKRHWINEQYKQAGEGTVLDVGVAGWFRIAWDKGFIEEQNKVDLEVLPRVQTFEDSLRNSWQDIKTTFEGYVPTSEGNSADGCGECKWPEVIPYRNGKRVCENCRWDQSAKHYDLLLERFGTRMPQLALSMNICSNSHD